MLRMHLALGFRHLLKNGLSEPNNPNATINVQKSKRYCELLPQTNGAYHLSSDAEINASNQLEGMKL